MAQKFLTNIDVSGKIVIDGSIFTNGSTVLDVQGSQGQLFSVTNSLSGDLFSISDISGIPILNVNSSGLVTVDGDQTVDGHIKTITGNSTGKFAVMSTGVHSSYDFYNDGTSYLNGAVTVDAAFTQTGGAASTFSGTLAATHLSVASTTAADIPLILGSSNQTNYTLQQWQTSAHAANEAYILAYGASHTSQAGNFAMKNIESGGEIFFELAAGVEPLRLTSTGSTFAGAISTPTGSTFAGAIKITETGTAQHILIGNQDSAGTDKPSMIMGVNGALKFGYGNSWVGEGGTFTPTLTLDTSSNATFAGNIAMAANATVDGVDISALPTTFAPTNAEQNVQSDWTEATTTSDAFILNKPTIPTDYGDHANLYLPIGGGTLTDSLIIKDTNATTTTTGTTLLELWNVNTSDNQQQQSFIDFKFTDTNANFTPQVRIGAQVGPDADANAISKEGAGSFVVYTAPIGSDELGGSTGLAEQFRVSHNGTSTFAGNIVLADNATVDGVDISELPTSFAPTDAEANVQANWTETTTTDDAFILNKPSTFPPSTHNHDDRYYTETESNAKFLAVDGSSKEWIFEISDESAITGNKWYKVATVNKGNGGLHIRGFMSNHVEGFAMQKLDLAIGGREGGTNDTIEVTGQVDVLHNASGATDTDKCGIRIIESDITSSSYYHYFDVYVRTTRYQMLRLHLTKSGETAFHTSPTVVTTEPAPVSGGTTGVEIDTSTLGEGNYVVDNSTPREIYHEGHKPTPAEIGAAADTVVNQTDFVSATTGGNFGGDITVHTGAGSGSLSVGRTSDQSIKLYITDTNNSITAAQDSDGNQAHNFILNRTFAGTGDSNFKIQKGGSDQFTLNSAGLATFAGSVQITGALTVNGTTTTINTATVEVEDNILQLNTTQGTPDTATATTSGISIYRGVDENDVAITEASLIFDDGDDTWDLTNNLTVAGDVIGASFAVPSGASTGFLKADGSVDGTTYSGYNFGATDLSFQGSDPGDIVWKAADGTEVHRLWSGSADYLTYRNDAGTTYELISAGSTSYNNGDWDNAFTHAESAHAPTNAEQNVQANWTETTTTSDAFILNNPGTPYLTGVTDRHIFPGLAASAGQARKHHIGRVYYCPKHWDTTWQNIYFTLNEETYNSGYVKYHLFGYYNGTDNQTLNLRVVDYRGNDGDIKRYKIVLGTHTDAGWDHSGQNVYYTDIYVEVAYYKSVKVVIDALGHSILHTDPTSGAGITVIYETPTITDITYTDAAYNTTYLGSDTKIWNSANDGSGSGLDADTVDGTQGNLLKRINGEFVLDVNDDFDSETGTWAEGTNTAWGEPNITGGYAYNDGTGSRTYDVPTGAESCWISHLTWSSGGYVDVLGVQSDGGEVFLRRINTHQTVQNSDEGAGQHDGSTITFAGTSLSSFGKIKFKNRNGRFHLTGITFSSSQWEGTEGTGMVHAAQITQQGTGGGLDSDKLDGQQGTYYLNYNNFTNTPTIPPAHAGLYLPLSGGTMTGSLINTTATAWGTNLKLINTNADSSPPILTFLKNGGSPADSDYVGFTNYRMDNSNGDEFSWVELSALAIDVTDGSESSAFRIGTWGAGTEYPNTIIAKSGNVGIGIDSPTAKLHIANEGEGEFSGANSSGASNSHLVLKDEGGTSRTLMSGPSIVFQTPANTDGTNVWATSRLLGSPAAAGSARGTFSIQVRDLYDPLSDGTSWNWRTALTAINTGNIGIGTNSPDYKLDVEGDISLVGGGENYAIMSPINQGMQIAVGDPAAIATPLVTFDGANQRVGIGTTTPSEKLEVSGKIYVESQGVNWNETTPGLTRGALHFDPVGSGADHTGNAITFGASDSSTGTTSHAGIYTRSNGTYGSKMYFATTDSYAVGSKSRMMIDYNGNIGLGTSSPQQKLHIEGNIYMGPNNTNNFVHSGANLGLQADGEVKIVSDVNDTSGGGASDIIFGYGSSTNTDANQNFTEAELSTYPRVEVMRIDASSNRVGIGTDSPSEKLDVNGNIKVDNALLANQENTNVDTGTEAIASVVLATYTAAFFDFVIKKGTNVRSGTVYACHDGTNVEFTETSTNDLGDTSDVTLNVVIASTYLQLQATTTSDDWIVKSLIRAL
jgi:hypothetical protein